jgi:hypothetical protein
MILYLLPLLLDCQTLAGMAFFLRRIRLTVSGLVWTRPGRAAPYRGTGDAPVRFLETLSADGTRETDARTKRPISLERNKP